MSDNTPIRLSKAAKEFNVGTQTIVEVLAKKGHKIDGGPNAKIPPDLYMILVKEFEGDKKVKTEANKIGLSHTKNETVILKESVNNSEVQDAEPQELIIKNNQLGFNDGFKKKTSEPIINETSDPSSASTSVTKNEASPTVLAESRLPDEPETRPKAEEKLPEADKENTPEIGIKILGKIDLDSFNKKPSKPTEPESKKKEVHEAKANTEEKVNPSVVAEEKVAMPEKVETAPSSEPIISEKLPEKALPIEPDSKEEVQSVKSNIEVEVKVEPKHEEPALSEPIMEKVIDNVKEKEVIKEEITIIDATPTVEVETPVVTKKVVAEVKSEPKVSKESHPKEKQTPVTPKQETPQKPQIVLQPKNTETAPSPVEEIAPKPEEKLPENFYRTEVKKLEGPVILGSIELPDKRDKKKPVASSSDDKLKNKKKKRKRLPKPGEEGAPAPQQSTQSGESPTKPHLVLPGSKNHQGTIRSQGNQQGGNQNRQGGGPNRPGGNQSGGPGQGNNNRPGQPQNRNLKKNDRRNQPRQPEQPKVELTDEEIERQIKETLARLTTGGKSKASKHRRQKRDLVSERLQEEQTRLEESKSVLKVTEFVTANELATMMNVHVNQVISTCMSLGLIVSINQRLDAETIAVVADEFGFSVEFVSEEVQEVISELEYIDNEEDLHHRAPIVTVMGHVDHGKTKLLDYVRSANVVAGEAGGITQHIGAYEVQLENGKKITFLDTPGHEAFTAMRARGAKVTDIAIIVIAADDCVMPQTREAINHAQAAGVPMIFAINKIDKPSANPEKVKEELAQMNILVEDWGGKYQSQEISAKSGLNIDLLLEKVLLEAELLDLKANPDRPAVGTVIESSLDKGRGYTSTVLVQNGSMKVGDLLIAGTTIGKIKAMYNERNQAVKKAGPSTPVLVLGLNGAPQAGDKFNAMTDEKEAKAIVSRRQQLQREQGLRTQKHITLDEIGRRIAIGDFKELNLIVKGDVDGSVEALSDSLLKLTTDEVQVNVIHKSVGQVTETDVMLASASNAIIIGFQVRPSGSARKLAEQEQIDIRIYSIIYNAIEEIKDAIEGMLSPKMEEKILCNIEIREVFKISKVGNIAGCMVLDGSIGRNTRVRLIRDGIVVYTGHLGSLKRFKDDAKEVKAGQECGLNIDNFNDIKVGDIIEGFEEVEIKRTLK